MRDLSRACLLAGFALGLNPGGNLDAADAPADPVRDNLVPEFVSYEPPAGYVRNPHAPAAPEWYHPDHDIMPEVEFDFMPVGYLFGEDSNDFIKDPSWAKLRLQLMESRWPPHGQRTERVLTETTIDGRPVLFLDFKRETSPGDVSYWSILWIPVAPNLVVEAHVCVTDPQHRRELQERFTAMRVNRYWTLPGSERVATTIRQPLD